MVTVLLNFFSFVMHIVLLPFWLYGTINASFAEAWAWSAPDDKKFFASMIGFSLILFILFVDLTNMTVGMLLSVLGDF